MLYLPKFIFAVSGAGKTTYCEANEFSHGCRILDGDCLLTGLYRQFGNKWYEREDASDMFALVVDTLQRVRTHGPSIILVAIDSRLVWSGDHALVVVSKERLTSNMLARFLTPRGAYQPTDPNRSMQNQQAWINCGVIHDIFHSFEAAVERQSTKLFVQDDLEIYDLGPFDTVLKPSRNELKVGDVSLTDVRRPDEIEDLSCVKVGGNVSAL